MKENLVEVVRCRDCEFCTYDKSSFKFKCTRRGAYPEEVEPNDYCSKGRKIEE